jgi:hypothetical protein
MSNAFADECLVVTQVPEADEDHPIWPTPRTTVPLALRGASQSKKTACRLRRGFSLSGC